MRDLSGDWQDTQDKGQEALTQAIGRLAREAGFQGVQFPSAVKEGGSNVVLFRDRVPGDRLQIIRKEKLPPKKS